MIEWEDTLECRKKDPTENELIRKFDNLSDDKKDKIIKGYDEYEELDDDKQVDWWKYIDTDSLSFGKYLLENWDY